MIRPEIEPLIGFGPLKYHVGHRKNDARHGRARVFNSAATFETKIPRLAPGEMLAIEIPAHHVVIDIDNAEHVPFLGPIPSTLAIGTPNGVHFYFRVPDGVDLPGVISLFGTPKIGGISVPAERTARQNELARSIDLLVPGSGYAIVPPTPGYRIAEATRPVFMPSTMITAIWDVLLQLQDLETIDRASFRARGEVSPF